MLGLERLTDPNRRLSDPERDEAIVALEAGLCPLCGLGPFTVVAGHVASAHGIRSKDLRRALGISQTRSICDPGHSRAQSARSTALNEQLRAQDDAMARRREVIDKARGAHADALIELQREVLATIDRFDIDYIVGVLADTAAQAGVECRLPERVSACRERREAAKRAELADPEALEWVPIYQDLRRTHDGPGLLAFYSGGEWGDEVPLPAF